MKESQHECDNSSNEKQKPERKKMVCILCLRNQYLLKMECEWECTQHCRYLGHRIQNKRQEKLRPSACSWHWPSPFVVRLSTPFPSCLVFCSALYGIAEESFSLLFMFGVLAMISPKIECAWIQIHRHVNRSGGCRGAYCVSVGLGLFGKMWIFVR